MLQSGTQKKGECEVCEKVDIIVTCHYGNMWFCEECWVKEEQSIAQNKAQNPQAVAAYRGSLDSKVVETSRAIDDTIQVRTDLFNAATKAIVDLKKAIDENPEVVNKPYALAEVLTTRFNHFKDVIFSLNEQMIEAGNHQKAIQIYLNQLANSLRAEEREKLKIADINYRPTGKPTRTKPISTTGTKKSGKLDKAELRKYAAELGVSEFTLQMVCVAQGITPDQAANKLKKSITEAKGQ